MIQMGSAFAMFPSREGDSVRGSPYSPKQIRLRTTNSSGLRVGWQVVVSGAELRKQLRPDLASHERPFSRSDTDSPAGAYDANSHPTRLLDSAHLLPFCPGHWMVPAQSVNSSADFFMSGRSLPPWVTGLAFLAANLGALEMIGMAAPAPSTA